MFSYSGELEEVAPGRLTSKAFTTRGYVKIGGKRIRSVTVTDFMDGLLEPGENMTLSMGFLFFRRWLLAVRRDGELLREGVFIFLAGILAHLVGMLLIAGLAAVVVGSNLSEGIGLTTAAALALYGIATAAINIKAWLAPT